MVNAPELSPVELDALATVLAEVPAAVYLPATGRIHRCPNPLHHPTPCERQDTFTLADAQLLAQRMRSGELGYIAPDNGPVVLAYGIPWADA